MKNRKTLSIFLTVVMLFTMIAPAFAYTKGHVDVEPTVQNDGKKQFGTLLIEEDEDYPNDMKAGRTFKLTLPAGVDWDEDNTSVSVYEGTYNDTGWGTKHVYTKADSELDFNDESLYITLPGSTVINGNVNRIEIDVWADVDGFSGDVEVTVDGRESGISSGKFVVGRAAGDDCTVVALSNETIGETGTAGKIEITENAKGTLQKTVETMEVPGVVGNKKVIEKIELTLPTDFVWSSDFDENSVAIIGDIAGTATLGKKVVRSGKKAYIYIYVTSGTVDSPSERGVITITPEIEAKNDADFGEIEISVEGDDIDQADVVVAEYADWGTTLEVIDDVETVLSGTYDDGKGEELATIKLEEGIAGSLVKNRKIDIEFPEGVKIVEVDVEHESGTADVLTDSSSDIIDSSDRNEATIKVEKTSTDAVEYEITFYVSVAADFTGDIVAEFSGSAGVEGEMVIGKAVAPVTVEGTTVDLTLGTQKQVLGDIIITETQDEALFENKDIEIELPDGVAFDGTPNVEVVEGNLELDEDGIDVEDADNKDDAKLVIPIDSESTKPSVIKISDINVTIDRTVPYGPIVAKVKGDAFVENYLDDARDSDVEFDTKTIAKVTVGNLVTPVQGVNGGTALFTVGSTLYNVAGEVKVMDAAPYIKDGRTYVPVRYLAYALGVSEDDVAYENGVVTLVKGDDTVALTIGSTTLNVSGEAVQMDVAPEINNGRTMLPARFVAEAFGAEVGYDPATKAVAIVK